MQTFTVHGGTDTVSLPRVEVEAETESDAISHAMARWEALREEGLLSLDSWERVFVGTPTVRW